MLCISFHTAPIAGIATVTTTIYLDLRYNYSKNAKGKVQLKEFAYQDL